MPKLRTVRKAIAAAVAGLLLVLLTWATVTPRSDIAAALSTFLPPQLVPYAGPLAGLLVLVGAVWKAANVPATSELPPTLDTPALPQSDAVPIAAEVPAAAGTALEPAAPVPSPREDHSASAGAVLVADSLPAAATDATDGATTAAAPAPASGQDAAAAGPVTVPDPAPARVELPTSFVPLPR